MTLWQKITTGMKFLFGGFDSATDYLLNTVLNPYLKADNVLGKVQKAYDATNTVLGYLRKYADFCPSKWRNEYDALLSVVDAMVSAFADGVVERAEIQGCIDAFQNARAAWNED